jgi:hypothetical protein
LLRNGHVRNEKEKYSASHDRLLLPPAYRALGFHGWLRHAINIFITGASGLLGRCGDPAADCRRASVGAEPVRCDLDTVTAADVRGAEIVIHCAAFVEQWGPPDAWDRINVQGTQRMLGAAQQA